MAHRKVFLGMLAATVVGTAVAACGNGGEIPDIALAGPGGAGGQAAAGGGGSSGIGAVGPTGAESGPVGIELVSAATLGESASYRMVYVLGQSTQHQGKATSASYRLQGGVVGASGSEK